jgi:hypothetical protein
VAATADFQAEIEATRAHTESYATDPEFRIHWLGFTRESRNLRAQQLRAFGELVGFVTPTLSGWRILDVGCGVKRRPHSATHSRVAFLQSFGLCGYESKESVQQLKLSRDPRASRVRIL